ncbi:ferritin-like domain-containing protein [SAR86 cluster bacterium]|jgi:hypothetical protein|nr:ferritin-like domain-containing protein [bacterium]MEC7809390.1 ferritin-like domain-containing protein [Pseudomonadota bacterium]URQ64174.1 ferritin-like domain-containing protein [SAR86 cluster bacterium]|tara:strand:- start:2806 stop:3945 length:1140 start_codon:yes stop_codon:yes gene_type:complete
MKIKKVKNQPKQITKYPEIDPKEQDAVESVNEIFKTPLTGAYNWDYIVVDDRIKKLYELGKKLNWNEDFDLDWSQDFPKDQFLINSDIFKTPEVELDGYDDLSFEKKIEMDRHRVSWNLSQFLHGEQGALLVASQLVSCAPTFNAKLYAASQTFDEARHVNCFNRYLKEKIGFQYPSTDGLKSLMDKILTDERWDLKFIGMQIIIEGLALAAFNNLKLILNDGLLKQLLHYVIRDEARHVTFGVNYLEDYLKTLSKSEIEDRAQFAFEACVVMRDRLISGEVISRFLDYTPEEAHKIAEESEQGENFKNLLFTKIIPNLTRIGLITDKVKPKYEKLGVLSYQELEDNFNVDWAEISKPYETQEEIEQEISSVFENSAQN